MNVRSLFSKNQKLDIQTVDESVYFSLDDKIKRTICQQLKIFDPVHGKIFEEVNRLFNLKYRFVKGIEASQCGLAPILGPSNCIRVFIPRDTDEIVLPDYFEGFPLIRIYEKNTPNYRFMIEREKVGTVPGNRGSATAAV